MHLIILAAGTGSRLAPLTDDRPKCLVELAGKPILEWTLASAKSQHIKKTVIVGGYRVDQLKKYDVTLLMNKDYATTNMVHTLSLAEDYFSEDGFILSYGDIAYSPNVLKKLIETKEDISVVVDDDWQNYWEQRFEDPLADAETLKFGANGEIVELGNVPQNLTEIESQYIGLMAFKGEGVKALKQALVTAKADGDKGKNPFGGLRSYEAIYMTDLLQGMINLGEKISPVHINGEWVEIDSREDLNIANSLLKQGRLTQ